MPYYRGEAVGDSFLQSLIGAYRSANPYADNSDGPVIARLEGAGVSNVGGAASLGDRDRADIERPARAEAFQQEQLKVIRAEVPAPKELTSVTGGWTADDAAIEEYFASAGVDLRAVPPAWVPPASATYSSDTAGKVSAAPLVPQRGEAELVANFQRSIYATPSAATSGPPGPGGYSSEAGTDRYPVGSLPPQPMTAGIGGGFDLMTVGILGAMGLAVFFLMRK